MDADKRGYEESRFLTQSHEDAEGFGTWNIEEETSNMEVATDGRGWVINTESRRRRGVWNVEHRRWNLEG